uniref:Uncharacterized protein n=1 Tax=Arcella intermedia TaxID=1963864 RepID=A0A6B2L5Z1_9EUKA
MVADSTMTEQPQVPPIQYTEFQDDSPPQLLMKYTPDSSKNNFLKGLKWSPDGTCLLTNSENRKLSLYELQGGPPSSYSLNQVLRVSEGEDIYDFCWYPYMKSSDPSGCVFLSTSGDHPIHLWDAYTGLSRASYSGYDHTDSLVSAYCVCFSPDGSRIIAGYNKIVRIFDTEVSGRDCKEYPTVPIKSNRPQKRVVAAEYSLNGVISTVSCNPDYSGVVACGSFNSLIGLYVEKNLEPIALLQAHPGGVTQVVWSPCGNYLYSGGRRDPWVMCWDIRNTCDVIFKMPRVCKNNQKLFFDVDSSGRILATGSQNGDVLFYDLKFSGKFISKTTLSDAVNGVSIHPTGTLLATSTGQRHLPKFEDSESDNEESFDNSIALWNYDKVNLKQ